jgi:LacI family transcriptional regulator
VAETGGAAAGSSLPEPAADSDQSPVMPAQFDGTGRPGPARRGRAARRRPAEPTVYDIARLAGVSPSTVSRVLTSNARVSAERSQRVLDAMRALNFRPNAVARSLATSSTRTIAVLLPDITNQFFPALVRGVQLHAEERGYSVLLGQTDDRSGEGSGHDRSYLDLAMRQQVDGLVLIGVHVDEDARRELEQRQIPVVSLDRRVNIPTAANVEVDNRAGATMATRHLLDLGHRRIAHIAGPAALQVGTDRADGWRQAHADFGLEPDERLLAFSEFSEEGGGAAMRSLLAAGEFTAVFAANDLCALGAMAVLRETGRLVPGDVSVIGFDGIDHARYSWPPLTTIQQPAEDMGRRAASLLVGTIEDAPIPVADTQVTFPPELVVRASTGPPPAVPRT